MSLTLIDKETNKEIMVANGETNTKKAPIFMSNGMTQDPIEFIEKFDKAAKWNNWRDDNRKKETFLG